MPQQIDKLDLIRFHYLEKIRETQKQLNRLKEKLAYLEEFESESAIFTQADLDNYEHDLRESLTKHFGLQRDNPH